MGGGHEAENSPGIGKLLPFCLDLAALPGDSWSREPPHPCVTLVQCREMRRLIVLPSSSEYFSLQRTPLESSTKAKHLQMGAAGSCQENVGPSRPSGQKPRKQEGWCEAAPNTHALHSQKTLRAMLEQTRGQIRSRRVWGVLSATSLSEANASPRTVRRCPLSPRVCWVLSVRHDPAWKELNRTRGASIERDAQH